MIVRSLDNVTRQMDVLQKMQENSSANTANVNTPGYKYQDLIQSAMKEYDVYNNAGGPENNQKQKLGSINFGTEIDGSYTNFSQGAIKETGLPTDFAISGKGFFAVQLDNGQIGFTRSGNFKVDSENRLVTQDGLQVLGVDSQGKTFSITADNGSFNVDNKGYINGTQSKIMTVDFPDYKELAPQGGTTYISGKGDYKLTDTTIQQGGLESSNVDVMDQMVKMMEVSREFESNQKVLKVVNETLDKTVNDVGRN